MGKSDKINLTSKDSILKNWFHQAAAEKLNISCLVQQVVEYYAKTGESLYLGNLNREELLTDLPDVRKAVHYTDQSVYYLDQLKDQKRSWLKRVLENGIQISDEPTKLVTEKEAIETIERFDRHQKRPSEIVQESTQEQRIPEKTYSADILPKRETGDIKQESKEKEKPKAPSVKDDFMLSMIAQYVDEDD